VAAVKQNSVLIIGASALGTMFEWYDFFLYGALASFIASHFFSGVNETTAFILALAAFAVGFVVRPIGALVFGRIGDLVGRKNTFLATLLIMGFSTVLVGVLPGYDAIGIAAPLILVGLRILQGLAIGGEFGGAIIYVGEHAPEGKRGLHTAFIPAMAMGGLLLSLVVIMITRTAMAPDAFSDWGWRVPFLISAFLLGISLWIRLKLHESPVFLQMKAAGATSRAPLTESFLRWENLKSVLAVLFGGVAGQAVVFYTTTFYALFFLERTVRVDGLTTTILVGAALAIGAPLVVFFGWLSDRIGRKPVLMSGLALGALLFFPLFTALMTAANPALANAIRTSPVIVLADADDCSVQFDPLGWNSFESTSCDIVKSYLARAGVSYDSRQLEEAGPAQILIGSQSLIAPEPASLPEDERAGAIAAFRARVETLLGVSGYASKADPAAINRPLVVAILAALLGIAAMSTGSMPAIMVELFPARIRYSALSLPQNLGNGWFGGFLPATAFAIVSATGNVFSGLWYPVIVAGATCVIGVLFLPETRGRPMR
jgi:MFS family permease